jgi:hypothetical protein
VEGTVAGVLEQNQHRPYDVILAADCLFFEVRHLSRYKLT